MGPAESGSQLCAKINPRYVLHQHRIIFPGDCDDAKDHRQKQKLKLVSLHTRRYFEVVNRLHADGGQAKRNHAHVCRIKESNVFDESDLTLWIDAEISDHSRRKDERAGEPGDPGYCAAGIRAVLVIVDFQQILEQRENEIKNEETGDLKHDPVNQKSHRVGENIEENQAGRQASQLPGRIGKI